MLRLTDIDLTVYHMEKHVLAGTHWAPGQVKQQGTDGEKAPEADVGWNAFR